MGLSGEQRRALEEHGVVAPVELLSADELARVREAHDRTVASIGPRARIDELHHHFAWAQELATHPRLLDVVASWIGEDLLVHAVLLLTKHPGRPGEVPWHQDSYLSGWHRSPSVSAWIALSESTRENGCMRVIEGSHRLGPRAHDQRPSSDNLLWGGLTIADSIDEARARDLILAPGQVSLHQCNVVHGSQPNRASAPRIGFIVRFVTSGYRESRGPMLRARGAGDDRHLDFVERLPAWRGTQAELDASLARWRAAGGDGQFSNDQGR